MKILIMLATAVGTAALVAPVLSQQGSPAAAQKSAVTSKRTAPNNEKPLVLTEAIRLEKAKGRSARPDAERPDRGSKWAPDDGLWHGGGKSLDARTGRMLKTIPQVGDADEVWYDSGSNRYYFAQMASMPCLLAS